MSVSEEAESSRPGVGSPWPPVSVIMPVLNEEAHLREAVTGVLRQEYPGGIEVVLALGPSTDRTDVIAQDLADSDERITLVTNPGGHTPAGLNAAIRASQHDVLVRVDGHGELCDGYVRRAVELLAETGAANVGGVQAAAGHTPFEQAVACAYSSPLGIGGARFHVGGHAGPTESVFLGVFRRDVLEQLGGFDELYRRAQDWELNYRIRQAGGTVWFSPDLYVTYRPRSTWRALARQFYQTGKWRRLVVRKHPDTASARYLAPPAAVVACAAGLGAGVAGVAVGSRWLASGFVVPAGYLAALVAGSAATGQELPINARLRLPGVLATMHLSWGLGFLLSPRSLGSDQSAPSYSDGG